MSVQPTKRLTAQPGFRADAFGSADAAGERRGEPWAWWHRGRRVTRWLLTGLFPTRAVCWGVGGIAGPVLGEPCQRGSGTARGQGPGGCHSARTLLPRTQPQGGSALEGARQLQPGGEGRPGLISRAQRCQMTPALHYRLLTTPFITAKWFAVRRLPTGLPSLAAVGYQVWIKLDRVARVINQARSRGAVHGLVGSGGERTARSPS